MKRLFIAISAFSILLFASASRIAADETRECTTSTGSYGQATTTCKVQGEVVSVEHKPAETGLGDFSFYTVAAFMLVASAAFFGIAKISERLYWFD